VLAARKLSTVLDRIVADPSCTDIWRQLLLFAYSSFGVSARGGKKHRSSLATKVSKLPSDYLSDRSVPQHRHHLHRRNFRGVQGGLVPHFLKWGTVPPLFSPPHYKKCRQNDVVCVLCRTVGPPTFQTKVTPLIIFVTQEKTVEIDYAKQNLAVRVTVKIEEGDVRPAQ
jgi:hypothetical protein